MKKRTFYQLAVNEETSTADIDIYGNLTSMAEIYESHGWSEGEVSARGFKAMIDGLNVDTINVYINSYGGEVAEALAICSALKRHRAQVHTFVDGFACSAASVVFCAGDQRTMGSLAMLMIHNCMSYLGYANSEEMRKAAEDNDKINSRSIKAYKEASNLEESKIIEMMNKETWLTAEECLEYGFATDIDENEGGDEGEEGGAKQSALSSIRAAIMAARMERSAEETIAEAVERTITGLFQEGKPLRKAVEGVIAPAQNQEAGDLQADPAEEKKPQNKMRRFFGVMAGK